MTERASLFNTEQTYYLEQLAKMTIKVRKLGKYLRPDDKRMTLLKHCVLARSGDCEAVGVGKEAQMMTSKLRGYPQLPAPIENQSSSDS